MNKTVWFSTILVALALIALSISIANNFINIIPVEDTANNTYTETPPKSDLSETNSPPPTVSTIQTHTITLKVKKGDNLLHILQRAGISNNDAFATIEALKNEYDPSKLSIGQEIIITSSIKGTNSKKTNLHKMQIDISPTDKIIIEKKPDGTLSLEKKHTPLTRHIYKTLATIDSSLYTAAKQAGLSANHIMKLISIYSYDIDFQRDIKKGDTITVLYESLHKENGKKIKDGDIIYASLKTNNTEFPIYLYEGDSGIPEYYTKNGQTIRKSLLKTPVDGARLSSGYGMRKHPVLGYSKMHKGIDFAAPIGTPIYAAGNGKIVEIGRKGSFGNYIKIRHNNTYATAYAHLHRFARGMKKNKYVKQGEIIGHVGKTGRVTGAHLHYEIHRNNKAINPKHAHFQPQKTIAKEQLSTYLAYKNNIDDLLSSTQNKSNIAVAMEGIN